MGKKNMAYSHLWDVCDGNTNAIDDLDNHIRSKHGELIHDLVSNIKLTTLASQPKLGNFSSPCELCDYDRDMAGQIKKHAYWSGSHIYVSREA